MRKSPLWGFSVFSIYRQSAPDSEALRPRLIHINGGSTFRVTAALNASHLEFTPAEAADRPLACDQGEEVNHMTKLYLWALARQEEGQTMAEYGVVLAVITLLIVGTLGLLSGAINGALNSVIGVL